MLIAAVKTNRNGYGKRESNNGSFGNHSRHESEPIAHASAAWSVPAQMWAVLSA